MAKKKLSHDQKRKQKLAARERKTPRVQPYEGRKYQGPEYAEALMRAEQGILEAYVVTGRRLTDRQVERSLEYLILDLRGQKPATPPADTPQITLPDGGSEDMIADFIKRHW